MSFDLFILKQLCSLNIYSYSIIAFAYAPSEMNLVLLLIMFFFQNRLGFF